MSQICIDNHYVPQFYLGNWSIDGTHVWMYRKIVSSMKVPIWKHQAISGTAFEKHLYAQNQVTGLSDDFEHWINESVETPAKPVINRLINGFEINQDDKEILSRFFIAQYLRTPFFFFRSQSTFEQSAKTALERTKINMDSMLDKIKSGETIPKKESVIPLLHQPQMKVTRIFNSETVTGFYIDVNTGRATWLSTIRRLVDNHFHHMAKNNWQILSPPNGMEWPASDDPAICLHYYGPNSYIFDGGICVDHATLLLPLGPSHLLFTEVGSTCQLNNLGNFDELKKTIYRIILEHAFFSVYCTSRKKFMQEECRPIVSPQYYSKIREYMKSWNSDQTSVELDFL